MKIARREYSSITEIASFEVDEEFMRALAAALEDCHPVNAEDVMPTIDEAAIATIVREDATAYDKFMVVDKYDCEMSLTDVVNDFIDDWFCGNAESETVDQEGYDHDTAYVVPEDLSLS